MKDKFGGTEKCYICGKPLGQTDTYKKIWNRGILKTVKVHKNCNW